MKKDEFKKRFNKSLMDLSKIIESNLSEAPFELNFHGRSVLFSLDDLVDNIFIDEEICYQHYDVSIINKEDRKFVFVRISGFPPVPYENFSYTKYGLPIYLLI